MAGKKISQNREIQDKDRKRNSYNCNYKKDQEIKKKKKCGRKSQNLNGKRGITNRKKRCRKGMNVRKKIPKT